MVRSVESERIPSWYVSEYLCPKCGTAWEDEWSCGCNDRCPACHLESSPMNFIKIVPGDDKTFRVALRHAKDQERIDRQ